MICHQKSVTFKNILLHNVYFYFFFFLAGWPADRCCRCRYCRCIYLFVHTVSITSSVMRWAMMRFINKNKRSDFFLLFLTEWARQHSSFLRCHQQFFCHAQTHIKRFICKSVGVFLSLFKWMCQIKIHHSYDIQMTCVIHSQHIIIYNDD